MGSLLQQQVQDEDSRIAKEVAQNEAKLLREEQFKEKKFRQTVAEINQHRIHTVSLHLGFKLRKEFVILIIFIILIAKETRTRACRAKERRRGIDERKNTSRSHGTIVRTREEQAE